MNQLSFKSSPKALAHLTETTALHQGWQWGLKRSIDNLLEHSTESTLILWGTFSLQSTFILVF